MSQTIEISATDVPRIAQFCAGHLVYRSVNRLLGHTTWQDDSGAHYAALTNSGKWPESAWMEHNAEQGAQLVIVK